MSPRRSDAGLSAEEREAMRETMRERSRQARSSPEQMEADVLAKIAEMPEPDRTLATRVHEIVRTVAPGLAPRTWYGMPAYARDGKVVCYFQNASKFKARYATLGFSDQANLDDGTMWPVAFALSKLTPAVEKRIAALVKQAAA